MGLREIRWTGDTRPVVTGRGLRQRPGRGTIYALTTREGARDAGSPTTRADLRERRPTAGPNSDRALEAPIDRSADPRPATGRAEHPTERFPRPSHARRSADSG